MFLVLRDCLLSIICFFLKDKQTMKIIRSMIHNSKVSYEVVGLQPRPQNSTAFEIRQLLRLSETPTACQHHWLRKY